MATLYLLAHYWYLTAAGAAGVIWLLWRFPFLLELIFNVLLAFIPSSSSSSGSDWGGGSSGGGGADSSWDD